MRKYSRLFADFVERQLVTLRRYSGELLGFIILVAVLAAISITQGNHNPILSVSLIVIFGIALTVACLFVFPYAKIWEDSPDGSQQPGQDDGLSRKPSTSKDYNSTRNMLIAVVGGAFTLSTLYFTFRSAEESSRSSEETKAAAKLQAEAEHERQTREEVRQAVELLAQKQPVAHTAGLYVLDELLKKNSISQLLAYKLVTLYVKSNSTSPLKGNKSWRKMSDSSRKMVAASPVLGVGSLSKRAGDIQFALNVLSEHDKTLTSNGLYSPRIDLRDLHLQGAALGHGKLQGALFSGAHLDYMDTRTSSGPYADFRMADFQGATLFGAYFNNANLTGAKLNTPLEADGQPRTQQSTLLRYASLVKANLTKADLSGSDLTNADLRGANLNEANLANTILTGAHFGGVDLTGAKLKSTNLAGIKYTLATRWPGGFWVRGKPDANQLPLKSKLCRVRSCSVSWEVVKFGTSPTASTS